MNEVLEVQSAEQFAPGRDGFFIRELIAEQYIQGQGIEIGALHAPLKIPASATVSYLDRMDVADLRQQYPELSDFDFVNVDIIDDGEVLAQISDDSQDFVIANHFLEHCQDPIGAIKNILRVLKPGGILYLSVPDKRYTFDSRRPTTTVDHLIQDHQEGCALSQRQHVEEWVKLVDNIQDPIAVEQRIDYLLEIDYSIHYHTFTSASLLEFFTRLNSLLAIDFDVQLILENGIETVCVLRKNYTKVTEGKQGWLFLDNDTNRMVSQIQGELKFTPKELMEWRLLLEMRQLWLKQHNISYFCFVAPNKACVYPEFLPDSIHLSEDRSILQLIHYLAQTSFAKIIYPLPHLVRAKQKTPVYRMRDTHWNSFGAYVAYTALLSEILKVHDLPIVSYSSVRFEEYDDPISDLGLKLGIPGGPSIGATLLRQNAQCVFDNQVIGTGHLMIFENKNQNLPKAILFRDSFANLMLDFIAESFSRLVVAWQPNLDYHLIEEEKPDIVITQQVERFLIKIPDDLKGPTNEERFSAKMGS